MVAGIGPGGQVLIAGNAQGGVDLSTAERLAMPIEACEGSVVWRPAQLREDHGWTITLGVEHVRELREALGIFRACATTRKRREEVQAGRLLPWAASFPLPTLGPALVQAQHQLEHGRGVYLIRNFPLDCSEEDARLMYGGLLSYIGSAQPQTVQGELLQPVQDEGQAQLDERRGSKHNLGLPIHNDGCDVVGFLCRRTPASGGTTILVSAASVHNTLLREEPDLLRLLYGSFHSAWQDYMFPAYRNAAGTGLPRTWAAPIFSELEGHLCCRYSRFYIDRAQEYPDVPRLNGNQLAALDALDELLQDEDRFQYRRDFERGDVLLLNNHVVLHSRTQFVDGDTEDQCRQVYRAWMAVPNSRPLSPSLACFFGSCEAGVPRGGVKREFLLAGPAQRTQGTYG